MDNNHFNAISSVDDFLRTMLNMRRVNCDNCKGIFSTPSLRTAHTCPFTYGNQDEAPPKLCHDPVSGLSSKYKIFEGTNREQAYVKPTKAKVDCTKGILYVDFETFPVPQTDIPQPVNESYLGKSLLNLSF